ncbi:polysaccharide biosynthesis protein [Moheibacter sediminis]|uniref:polysaccharide biosynthesis protein n=1 Tax=Moheibacter sediminis TaxID=1434700 RepID=UPI002937359B|nr:nucleoside-diphosphate sugar epimerase/dehydratase [Moheibacter sediminis]
MGFLIVTNFKLQISGVDLKIAMIQSPQVLFFAFVAFVATSSYKGIVRHTGFKDILSVLRANVLLAFMLGLFSWLVSKASPESVHIINAPTVIIHFLLNTMALIFLRILYKNLYDYYVVGTRYTKRAMIYGAGDSGVITYKALKNDERSRISIFGYLDDKKSKTGKKINGVTVYDPKKVDARFLEKHHINEIIISIQNIRPSRLREIVDSFTDSPVTLKIVPAVNKWLNGDLNPQQIKAVKIEDLLGRKPIKLDNPEIREEIRDKVVLVTGAAGSIGSEISRQLMGYPYKKLILVDQAESPLYDLQQTTQGLCKGECEFVMGDVRDPNRVDTIFRIFRPQIVFHAAAYKHVPLMEDNPYEAVHTNVKGTKIVADKAAEYEVEKFVMVSTDKAVNPTNVMGATKRLAELYVTYLNKRVNTNFIVTRFGNVLGSNGSVIPIFKRQIEEGGPLTVTHPDITRFFMTIPEACQLVLEAGVMGKGGEVFVFDMGESVKIIDLAKKIIRLSGMRYPQDIDIKITGLRPGEKIFEELLADGESTMKTHHEKIMIATVCNDDSDEFNEKIQELIKENHNPNQREKNLLLVTKIKELVPEYVSQNSIYTSIDEQKNNV